MIQYLGFCLRIYLAAYALSWPAALALYAQPWMFMAFIEYLRQRNVSTDHIKGHIRVAGYVLRFLLSPMARSRHYQRMNSREIAALAAWRSGLEALQAQACRVGAIIPRPTPESLAREDKWLPYWDLFKVCATVCAQCSKYLPR